MAKKWSLHIPAQSGHRVRFKLATDSGRKWPPVPIDSGHFFPLSGIGMATLDDRGHMGHDVSSWTRRRQWRREGYPCVRSKRPFG